MIKPKLLALLVLVAAVIGCESAYYSTMESFGVHKRDILVDRVEEARDAQEETKEQFKSALERFSEVVDFKGGDLEKNYKKLKSDLDRSESLAEEVRERIDSVQNVAEDLFEEWQVELDQYTSQDLRRKSEAQLRNTRSRYDQMIGAMRRAESKIEPVLTPFRDQVLFLKHNLNAQAIASLQNELFAIENDVALLIREMEASIAEANGFIDAMSGG